VSFVGDATGGGEFGAIERLAGLFGGLGPGEVGIGDDAALVAVGGGSVVVAADALVEGVHFDLSVLSLADVGWKALAVNLSDLAAMGCVGTRAVVTVSGLDADGVASLYSGISDASAAFGCPVVGGDLTGGPCVCVSVTVLGSGAVLPPPVLRSGARPGDLIWVTGALGAAAWALRRGVWSAALARPVPRILEGVAARELGATAMIDVSDGFAADLSHILDASGVGCSLTRLPIADGATMADAVGGGDDYELIICGPFDIGPGLSNRGLAAIPIGSVVGDPTVRMLDGAPLGREGWTHF
jgi:thiamine-monophosphate kinase